MSDLPEIPDAALDAVNAIDSGAEFPSPYDALDAAWPHLYAAALRHAADELDEGAARMVQSRGGATTSLVAEGVGIGATRLRARADAAEESYTREG